MDMNIHRVKGITIGNIKKLRSTEDEKGYFFIKKIEITSERHGILETLELTLFSDDKRTLEPLKALKLKVFRGI
jgi:hypothetical protein